MHEVNKTPDTHYGRTIKTGWGQNTNFEARHEKQGKENIDNIAFPHRHRCNPHYPIQGRVPNVLP